MQLSTIITVAQVIDADSPCISFTATKMNILYRGVKNPVNIYIPGMPDDVDLVPTISGGSIYPDAKAEKGNYIVEVKGGSTGTINVYVDVQEDRRALGQFIFRVKDVPAAIATIAGVEEGLVSATRLSAARTVIAQMKNFDFELFFQVKKFDLVSLLSDKTLYR